MPDLEHTLFNRDLRHLKIIASLWGLELQAPDARTGMVQLIELLENPANFEEMLSILPEGARTAFLEMGSKNGRISWSTFTRRYGAVREMGIARRDREEPYKDPDASTAEILWYRGLIGRSFFNTPEGLVEFAFIPDEFLPMLPENKSDHLTKPAVRLALREEQAAISQANDWILDDACTLLAGLRSGMSVEQLRQWLICGRADALPIEAGALDALLRAADLIAADGSPEPELTKKFLEADRAELLPWLFDVWNRSQVFNEVRMLPGLQADGEWVNDPLKARQAVMGPLKAVLRDHDHAKGKQERPFWSLNSFTSWMRQANPDYQRSAGDFDSWYLYDHHAGRYLRGMEDWDLVDGALIRYLIGGPLHWLGFLDLGYRERAEGDQKILAAFRFSASAENLIAGELVKGSKTEREMVIVKSDGRIMAGRLSPRTYRYQIARFCEWDFIHTEQYHYVLTPKSLQAAVLQGLTVQQILSLLGRAAKSIPPSLIEAVKRWEKSGSEAQFEQVVVLRVKNPEIIQKLRASRAARFLGDPLGPAAIIVHSGSWRIVSQAIAEMGFLSESHFTILPPK